MAMRCKQNNGTIAPATGNQQPHLKIPQSLFKIRKSPKMGNDSGRMGRFYAEFKMKRVAIVIGVCNAENILPK
jgi:hypothetical protein